MSRNGIRGVWGDARRYYAEWEPPELEAKATRLSARLVAVHQLYAEKTGRELLPPTLWRMLLLNLPSLEKRSASDSR